MGNELQADMPAAVLAAQYMTLAAFLRELWPAEASRPWIIGPDENPDGVWLHEFLQACNGTVDAVTVQALPGRLSGLSIHHYSIVNRVLGARGASQPKPAVSGPGIHDTDKSSVGLVG